MSIGGIIFIAGILTAFTAFSAVLAWGVHQTNLHLREQQLKSRTDVARETPNADAVEHAKAA